VGVDFRRRRVLVQRAGTRRLGCGGACGCCRLCLSHLARPPGSSSQPLRHVTCDIVLMTYGLRSGYMPAVSRMIFEWCSFSSRFNRHLRMQGCEAFKLDSVGAFRAQIPTRSAVPRAYIINSYLHLCRQHVVIDFPHSGVIRRGTALGFPTLNAQPLPLDNAGNPNLHVRL